MDLVRHEAFLRARLTASPMTEEQIAAFSAEHLDRFFEMTAEGVLLVPRLNYSRTSARDSGLSE